jgi:DNA-binding NarL/FixJ family response regulator
MKIRVLVADDFPLLLEGVCAALDADPAFEVVGRASDGVEAAERAGELAPDVVLLDMMMPRCDGREAIERVRWRAPAARVIAISASERIELVRDALDAGAAGYLSKASLAHELRDAVIHVHGSRGRPFVSPKIAERVLRADSDRPGPGDSGRARAALLSPREHDVLRLIARGQSDSAIAAQLGIRIRTVQNHLARIRIKTRLRRRPELVTWAMRHGVR